MNVGRWGSRRYYTSIGKSGQEPEDRVRKPPHHPRPQRDSVRVKLLPIVEVSYHGLPGEERPSRVQTLERHKFSKVRVRGIAKVRVRGIGGGYMS